MSKKMLQAAAGNAGASLYVEDVFSTYLYTGNGSTQTITNDIDLAGEGGMVWLKRRNSTTGHNLFDTERGAGKGLASQLTNAESYSGSADGVTVFNSDGFGVNNTWFSQNTSGGTYASWTFRKAEKFFDVVTYTGDGVAGREIAHNLGSTPAFIIVKRLEAADEWTCYVGSLGATKWMSLNQTAGAYTSSSRWNDTEPTDSVFTVGVDTSVNRNTSTYVAYLFASVAGGFGDDGSESIIKCGSYTGTGVNGNFVNLGFEPQWLLIKSSTRASEWAMHDTMRGIATGGGDAPLWANLSNAESTSSISYVDVRATGFDANGSGGEWNESGQTYIYIAIRRPMKTPESGTEVFNTIERTGTGAAATVTGVGFTPDMLLGMAATVTSSDRLANDRMRGVGKQLLLNNNNAEATAAAGYDYTSMDMDGFQVGLDQYGKVNYSGASIVNYCFKRATGFFDVVAYSGDGVTGRTVTHNLGAAPELLMIKARDAAFGWVIGSNQLNGGVNPWSYEFYTWNAALTSTTRFNDTAPTDTEFTLSSNGLVNSASYDYVAYMFSSLDGVSKVGTYTGTGASLDVDCGFSAGARFVMVSEADYGLWYIYDTARGITVSTDPSLMPHVTTAQASVAARDINPYSGGFNLPAGASTLNTSGTDYIYLAIA